VKKGEESIYRGEVHSQMLADEAASCCDVVFISAGRLRRMGFAKDGGGKSSFFEGKEKEKALTSRLERVRGDIVSRRGKQGQSMGKRTLIGEEKKRRTQRGKQEEGLPKDPLKN